MAKIPSDEVHVEFGLTVQDDLGRYVKATAGRTRGVVTTSKAAYDEAWKEVIGEVERIIKAAFATKKKVSNDNTRRRR